eukprot:TRINITY_DN11110_c0_g1_i1.p1 TRINITY_DN11110_c0_g1~~TRINITY_DN11110_c0_g1_i1.p1  ORF type:complete len:171 (+),score=21.95 TRINITY_DN11110_c0_g1_i1:121-633(+)
MILWFSLSHKRYSTTYALNNLESKSEALTLDIPKCQESYDRLRKRLTGNKHARFWEALSTKVTHFEECLRANYPDLFKKYKELQVEGLKKYGESMETETREWRMQMTREQGQNMYKRAAERIEKSEMKRKNEAEKAGKEYVPSEVLEGIRKARQMEEIKGTRHVRDPKIF